MAVSAFILGVPDTSGDLFLANVNGAFQAVATCNISSTEPPVKAAGMLWFDSNTGRLKQRNQSNTAWVAIYAVRNNKCIPLLNDDELTSISTLKPDFDGYVSCKNGVFVVEQIDTPDIPLFGVNKGGIVPGVTSAQSAGFGILRSSGVWTDPGPALLGSVDFAGANNYFISVAYSRCYQIAVRAKLSGTQPLILQIGSGGSPTQLGYVSRASRFNILINTANSLSSGDIQVGFSESTDRGFILFRTPTSSMEFMMNLTLINTKGNKWQLSGNGGFLASNSDGDSCRGEVTLEGKLNYMKITAAGSPTGTFNTMNSIDSGNMTVLA